MPSVDRENSKSSSKYGLAKKFLHKKFKMSVSNPVDSGASLFHRDLQELAEQMNKPGGWANLMDEESANNTIDEEVDNNNIREQPPEERRSGVSFKGSFRIQVCGVPEDCDLDELGLYFGGEEKVKDLIPKDNRRVILEVKEYDHYQQLLANKTHIFKDKPIRLFNMPPLNQHQNERSRDSYSRQSSRHGSTTSLASGHHYNGPRDHRGYDTMPPPRSNRHDRGHQQRNNYDNYDRRGRGSYGGPFMRSESYTSDRELPARINRSRTDDGMAERRPSDMSRASSQFSINQDGDPKTRKQSAQEIFCGATPVDTAAKMAEMEKRLEARKQQGVQHKQEAEQECLQQQHHQQQQQHHQQQQQQQQHQQQQQQPPPQRHPHQQMQPQHIYSPYHQFNQPPPPTQYCYPPPHSPHPPQFSLPTVPMEGRPSPMRTPPSNFVDTRIHGLENRRPGSVQIVNRKSEEKDSHVDMSPPLDPEHPKEVCMPPVTAVVHSIDTIKEEPPARRSSMTSNYDNRKFDAASGQDKSQKPHKGPRTFQNSSHRGSYDGGRGYHRGRGRGRGAYHGSSTSLKADSAIAEGEKKEVIISNTTLPPVENKSSGPKKDYHGSQTSLNGRGGKYQRGNYRGRGGSHRDRPPRDDKKNEIPKDQQKPPQQRRPSKEEDHKTVKAPKKEDVKTEVPIEEKKEAPEAAAASAPIQQTPPATPTDVREKKKEKRKKANAAKNAAPLSGNRFAALADIDND